MMFLKQSTTVTLRVGPFLDKTDGVTEKTALSPVVEISKNNGAFAARGSATAITHDSNGWYAVELNATDTGTLGPFVLKSDDSATYLPVYQTYMVLPANVYDSFVAGTANLSVDATKWAGSATAANDTALATAPTNFASLSITAGGLVDITQAAADKVWSSTTRTLSAFSTTLAVSVWDVLETAVATASSMGLKVKTNLDAAITTRSMFDPAADTVATVTDVTNLHASAATVANQTTILARIGGFAGSGLNTVKGFLQAVFRSDAGITGANEPSEINEVLNTVAGTFDGTTDSVEAIRNTAPLGTAMRGTDSAALAADYTGARAAKIDNLDVAISTRHAAGAAVASVTGNVDGSVGSLGVTAKADVNAEVDIALSDVNLDHLIGTATGNPAVPAGTFLDQIMNDGTAVYDRVTDSLQAVRDRGDAAWTTGSGTGLSALASGTAQAGAATTITLASGATATTDIYKGARIATTGGTGAGQSRMITTYNGTTKVATIDPAWVTNPDATTAYEIQAADAQVQMWDHASADAADVALSAASDLTTVKTDTAAILIDTADMQPKLGAPAVDISADIAAVKAQTVAIEADTTGLAGAAMRGTDNAMLAASAPANFGSLSITAGGLVDITQAAADKIWSSTTRTLSAFSTALAVSIWDVLETAIATASSIGLKAKTNLDATVSTRSTFNPATDTVANVTTVANMRGTDSAALAADYTAARAVKIDNLDAAISTRSTLDTATVKAQVDQALAGDAQTESYAAKGSQATIVQLLYMLLSALGDYGVAGTTITTRKLDGTTTAMTFTTDDVTSPTSRARAT